MTLRPSDGQVLAVSRFAGHCRDLAVRRGDYGWGRSLSTAARKITEGNGSMTMCFCQQLVGLCLILLMKVECVTVVNLAC